MVLSLMAWLTKFLEQMSGKNSKGIPLMVVYKTKNDMKNTEKRQIVEAIYAKNMDRTDKGINDLIITEALAEATKSCQDSNEYFMVLSALNLLNSAIKDKRWKHDLSYGFIKGRAAELFEKWIKLPIDGVSASYNSKEGAVFFSVDGVVFSYHRIRLSERIRNFIQSPGNKPIPWSGVRLQKIPVELFDLAKAA